MRTETQDDAYVLLLVMNLHSFCAQHVRSYEKKTFSSKSIQRGLKGVASIASVEGYKGGKSAKHLCNYTLLV